MSNYIDQLDTFAPTGDESADVERLYEIVDMIDSADARLDALSNMFSVLERFPDAELGSPGPLVHAMESCDLGALLGRLVESLGRQPVVMTIWMAERCLRSPSLPDEGRRQLLDVLKRITDSPGVSDGVRANAADSLKYFDR